MGAPQQFKIRHMREFGRLANTTVTEIYLWNQGLGCHIAKVRRQRGAALLGRHLVEGAGQSDAVLVDLVLGRMERLIHDF